MASLPQPVAIDMGNGAVLFENGVLAPASNFFDEEGDDLPSIEGAIVMICTAFNKWWVIDLSAFEARPLQ